MKAAGAAAVAIALAACGAADRTSDLSTVRDSAGVRIAENVFPDSADAAWWRIEEVPLLDIGGEDAEETHSLYQVGDAHRFADGRIAVANGGASDVRYFSATGAHIRTTGRRGDGPGEFQRPWALLPLPGDSLLVSELFGGRASVLDPDGSFARTVRLPATGPGAGVFASLPDGSLLASEPRFVEDEVRDGFQRIPLAFVSVSADDGAVLDTVMTVPGPERVVHTRADASGALASIEISSPAFAKATTFAAGRGEIYIGTQNTPQVEVYDGRGQLKRIVRTGAPMPPVTEQHLDAWLDRLARNAPPEARQRLLARRENPDAGKIIPPYAVIEVDETGNLWISDFDDYIKTPGAWSVHDPDGRLLARIRLPEGFRVLQIGDDFVLGVIRDDVDVEHVRLYRLVK